MTASHRFSMMTGRMAESQGTDMKPSRIAARCACLTLLISACSVARSADELRYGTTVVSVEQQKRLNDADRLSRQADEWLEKQSFDQAVSDCDKALDIFREVLPADHPRLAVALRQYATACDHAGQTKFAAQLLEQAAGVLRRTDPPAPLELADCLLEWGKLCWNTQELAKGRDLLSESAELLQREPKPRGAQLVECLTLLASANLRMDETEKASAALDKVIVVLRKADPPQPQQLAVLLQRKAQLHLRDQEFEKARALLEESRGQWTKADLTQAEERVGGLAALAWIYGQRKEPEKSQAVLNEADEVVKQAQQQAQSCMQQAEYNRALNLRESLLEISHILKGEGHAEIAVRLTELAELNEFLGRYREAREQLLEALEILRSAGPEGHRSSVAALLRLGQVEHSLAHYEPAVRDLEGALKLVRRIPRVDPAEVALVQARLAVLLADDGEYERAESLFDEAVAALRKSRPVADTDRLQATLDQVTFFELTTQSEPFEANLEFLTDEVKQLPARHPFRVTFQTDEARRLRAAEQFQQAEAAYKATQTLAQTCLPPGHPEHAMLWNGLGMLYRRTGDMLKAEEAFQRARDLFHKFPFGSPKISVVENNLAELYATIGKHKAAQMLHENVLNDRLQAFPPDHPEIALTLNALGSDYQSLQEYDRAEKMYRDALRILEGRGHVGRFYVQHNLATLAADRGRVDEARELCQKVLELAQALFPPGDPRIASAQEGWFSSQFVAGEFDEALALSRKFLLAANSELTVAAGYQSERQHLASLFALRGHLDNYLSAAHAAQAPVEEVYDQVLAWKGAVTLNQELRRATILAAGADRDLPEFAKQLAELRIASQELERLYQLPPDKGARQQRERREQIQALSERREAAERELARLVQLHGSAPQRQPVTSQQMEKTLKGLGPDVVLCDMIEHQFLVPHRTGKGAHKEDRLSAFVVRPGQKVIWIELGEVEAIASLVEEWRTQVAKGQFPDKAGEKLREFVWAKLQTHVAGAKVVLVSPDGALSRLPLAALPGKNPGTFLIDEFEFATLPIPAKLPDSASPKKLDTAAKNDRLLLVGGIDYNGPALRETNQSSSTTPQFAARSLSFEPLQHSLAEIEEAGRLYRNASERGEVKQLTGASATRSAYLQLASKYRWHLISTHGFFGSPVTDTRTGTKLIGSVLPTASDDPSIWNPGVMSGLVFAGANRDSEQSDIGLLTALSISELDLRSVELVTLSACETGLGQSAGGEGVMGLQRAYMAAGAGGVVASLWKVDDAATQAMMTEFHRNLWERRLPPRTALRQAQLRMMAHYEPQKGKLRSGFSTKPIDEAALVKARTQLASSKSTGLPPFYWAAFVISGGQ